ncbi:hypothetical protein [uncultured Algimonas sp.]|uniref:hypothetical protein n=1 Tax=uncultured Algimonas sp. TaxID=1547920 RepID=UPI00261C215D|nr:hypothetical protein [uncultured Algimonas sp.]
MKQKVRAVWGFAVALLLYLAAFAALIWIWWTGRSVWWGLAIVALVILSDRTWLVLVRGWFGPKRK